MRDVNGSVLSIYVQNLGAAGELFQYEVAVYGSGRLGMYRPLEQASYYELKDHLGNVRVMIGGSTSVDYLATMETYRDSLENPYFEQNKVVAVADHLNHTPDSLANRAVRINNVLDQEPNVVGSGITLRVFPGDTLRAEVFAKYEDFDNTTNNVIPTLAGYLGTVFGVPGVGESPVGPFDVVDDPSFLSLEAWNQFDDQQPRLYLNYLLYDNNFNLVDFGFDQVSEAARIPEDTALLASHTFEKLMFEVVAEQAGFVYIYVSNENDQNVTAYFDDLGVEHTYGNVAVATDLYPFGLAIAGRELERIKWRYGYQGDFAEEDEETGWNSFEARMYDPVIGRWSATDPYFQFNSPYMAMGNNPILYQDSDGRWVHIAAGALIGGGIAAYNLYRKGELEWSWRAAGKIALGAGTGAAIAAVPGAALSSVGQLSTASTIAGVSTRLIGNSILAGTIAGTGNLLDQSLDVHTGHKAAVNLSDAAVNAAVTTATFGIGGHYFAQVRYAARHARWSGTNSQFAKFVDNLPNVSAATLNSAIDFSRAAIENNWWNFDWNSGGDNLVRGVTPWGFEYAIPKGQTVILPEIVITPDPE